MTQTSVPSTVEASPITPSGVQADPARRRRRGGYFPPVRGLLPLALFLAIWQLIGNPHSPYFPPPSQWWDGVNSLLSQGKLFPAVGATLEAFMIALVLATVIGSILGFLMGAAGRVDRALSSTLEFLRSMPSAAVVPVFVLIIGYNLRMKVTVVVFAAVWPVLLSTRSAARKANPLINDVARTLRLSRPTRLGKVVLPSMLPAILLGVQVAAPITLIITLLVEILTNVSGLGALLATAQNNFESAEVYGLVAVAGVIAVLLNFAVKMLEAYLTRYRPRP